MAATAVTLVGTGALASLMAGRLARAGTPVTLLGRWREALDAIAARGIVVEDETGRWSAPAAARHADVPTEPAPVVMVLVKSGSTAAVAQAAALATQRSGLILTFQNGLGNRELLEDAAGVERVALGVAFVGATSLGPGTVRDGGGSRLVIERHPRVHVAADLLSAAGFEVELADDITPTLWLKLAANCAINPLSALRGVVNGALLEAPDSRATMQAAAREVGAIAAALGVRLPCEPVRAVVEVARATAGNRSSMLADLARGVPTEIESLNGAVVRLAERLGIDVPVNRRLLEAIRTLTAASRPC